MQFADHFSGVASSYAAHRPGYPAELFRWLAAMAPRHRLAWDCACGSGQSARPLAKIFEHVSWPPTPAPPRSFPPLVPERSCLPSSPAASAPIADHAADLVTVAQALHWFAEREVLRRDPPRHVSRRSVRGLDLRSAADHQPGCGERHAPLLLRNCWALLAAGTTTGHGGLRLCRAADGGIPGSGYSRWLPGGLCLSSWAFFGVGPPPRAT